ncbi:TetR/AcrR family transcriptional regulator [Leucobacter chromiiresistens]|uniref:DNA-binding transcriptional regulator, AcrR family n=1 Tax=Leucobacter chromiiresistens TaxID=1079994 RepID=A0A1H0YMU4_9MICO|nr:TetR/AcrR family transcriptional regulator [Leucobacter chromiiresistens]SDQ16271.1 DNA-binding transcriptional regulator, AcrR family [Leucobacter chromiiresistens]
MPLRPTTERRILDAAEDLFFTRGIAATPIDAVTARAGVSPATLYRGYPSKDALLAAVLERRHRAWIAVWEDAIAQAPDDIGRLLAIFDALEVFREQPHGSRWCAFLAASAEYASAPPEVARAVSTDTEGMRSRLAELAAPIAGGRAPDLAEQLLLIVTGDLAMRLREPGGASGRGSGVARGAAAAIIEHRSGGA